MGPKEDASAQLATAKKEDARQYRINTYRVLLTRGRAGTAIFVPNGDETDSTLTPKDFDGIYNVLLTSGCQRLS
jgi:hypothetical protein